MILRELRYAARRLLSDAHLTITAVLTLSLGLASAVVMMDMLDRLLVRPPAHVADPHLVTRLYVGSGSTYFSVLDYPTIEALERELDELEHVAAYFAASFSLGRSEDAEQVEVVGHGPRYFDVLGVRPQLGSLVPETPNELRAVISDRLWRTRFGGTPDVLGRPLRLGTEVYTIAAVLPRGFAGVDVTAVDVWLPLSVRPPPGWESGSLASPFPAFDMIARLSPHADHRAIGAHATTVYRNLHDGPVQQERTLVFGDVTRSPEMDETEQVALWIAGMSLVVLLIACGNVANMLFVRGLRRTRDTSIKTALGASRARLMREVLVEGVLLSAAAGIVAFAIVVTAGKAVRHLFSHRSRRSPHRWTQDSSCSR